MISPRLPQPRPEARPGVKRRASKVEAASAGRPTHDARRATRDTASGDAALRHNYVAWVGYQLFYRIGWQFKMEATMVAGLVSYLSPSASVMGLFTTVSNLGRYAAPFWATGVIDAAASKKRCLLWFWALTTLCWTAAALFLWTPAARN